MLCHFQFQDLKGIHKNYLTPRKPKSAHGLSTCKWCTFQAEATSIFFLGLVYQKDEKYIFLELETVNSLYSFC